VNPYLRSQFTRRPQRALMVVAGVALGATLFVALTALGNGYREAARAPLADVAADLVVTRADAEQAVAPDNRGIRTPDGLGQLDDTEVEQIATTPGVTAAAGTVQLWDFGPRQTLVISGVDPSAGIGPGNLLNSNMVAGEPFTRADRGVAVLDMHYAQFYGLGVGSGVQIGGSEWRVVGIVEASGSSQAAAANVYLPLPQAQRLAGLDAGEVNQVHVRLADAGGTEDVVGALTDRIGPISAITEDDIVQIFGAVGEISARFATIAAVVALAGGALLAWFALRGIVAERTREIGILRAVGWRRKDVVRSFLLESALLSATGAVCGLLLGVLVAATLAYIPLPSTELGSVDAGHTGAPLADSAGTLPASVTVAGATLGFVAAVVSGSLAGLVASARAAAIRPAQNLRAQ